MEPKKLSLEELEAIASKWISVASQTEVGRELLRRFAAGGFAKYVSITEQLPPDMAEEFAKTVSDVYEELIRGRTEEHCS